MLLALAGSPFAKAPPVKMAFIPGVTRTPNQSDVVMSFRKSKDRKKEKEKEKKTCKFRLIEILFIITHLMLYSQPLRSSR
jgi:hypothetical protein